MSRLQALPIPFSQGQTDEINPKLLPNGVLADLQNGRMPQQGGLRLRRGWRPLTMATDDGDTLTALDLYSSGENLVARCRRSADTTFQRLAVFADANASHPWHVPSPGPLPAATNVRDYDVMPEAQKKVEAASCAVTYDGVYGCSLLQYGIGGSSDYVMCSVLELATGASIAYFQLSTGIETWHVVSAGTTFKLIRRSGGAVTLYTLDPASANPATLTGPVTLVASGVDSVRAAVARETTPTLLHLATLESGTALYRQFTLAGGDNGSASISGTADAVALASDDTTVWFLWKDSSSHEISLASLSTTSPFSTTVGPSTLFSSHVFPTAQFPLGVSYNASNVFCAAEDRTTGTDLGGSASTQRDVYVQVVSQAAHASQYSTVHSNARLTANWLVKGEYAAVGLCYAPVEGGHTNIGYNAYVGCGDAASSAPWMFADFSVADISTMSSVATHMPADVGQGPLSTALAPFFVLGPTGTARPIVRSLDVAATTRRSGVELDGVLYIAGGLPTQFTSAPANQVETGMPQPLLRSWSTSTTGGSVADGSYSYIAALVWGDSQHRTHRSPLSNQVDVTVSGGSGSGSVAFSFSLPKSLRRDSASATPPRIELYRTEAGPGDLFYFSVAVNITSTADDLVSLTDISADATIIDNAQLYTQGETGATSGILEQAPPAPSSFATATKRRLVLASTDTSYQWSQTTLPDIPVFFTDPGISGDAAQAYFDDVEGAITGVASMDELVYVGTSQRIFITGGTGPNLAGTGEFTPPTRLPTDIGFFNIFTILETSEGLWFQGSANTMYLLARGTPTPTLSRAVQDHLTGTLVGCGYDHTDNIAAWAMASPNRLLFRQLDTKQWFTDTLPFTPIALHSHLGHLYAVDSAGTVWAQDATAYGDSTSGGTAYTLLVTSGALQPFGLAGSGRLGVVEVLGEYQADASILAEISYDDGTTWTSLGSHSITGLSAGTTFQRQWYPANQRGGRFRFRFTMTPTVTATEGCRLVGCTAYIVLKSGQTRLDSAKRR